MDQIRYIHAADLHLDTPFAGIAHSDAALSRKLREAAFTALNSLTRLCLDQKPDFLLLAGDLYNDNEHSIKAQLKLYEACTALDKAGIAVFIAHGNHDPLSSRIHAMSWPANTFFFPAEAAVKTVERNGEILAMVHGVSHATGREERNLARLIKRDPEFAGFQVGLLHCNADGAVQGDRYAPCSVKDLKESGLDAWALGHAHTRNILAQQPFIAYSGNTQGLHPNETGLRGCYLVTAQKIGDGWQCAAEFHALGPVVWEKTTINLEGSVSVNEVENRINTALSLAGDSAAGADLILLKAVLTGRTALAGQLTRQAVLEELAEAAIGNAEKEVILHSLANETAPLADDTENLERDDLLGEVSRVAQSLAGDSVGLHTVLQEVFQPLGRAAKGVLQEPGDAEQQKLLNRARRICQDILEDH